MKHELEDVKAVLGLKTFSDKDKLSMIEKIVEPNTEAPEELDWSNNAEKAISKQKRSYTFKNKSGKRVQKTVTKQDLEIVERVLKEKGRTDEAVEYLMEALDRTKSSIDNIVSKYSTGKYKKKFGMAPESLRNKPIPTKNSYRRYTQTEIDTIIKERYINGNSVKKISKLIGRSIGSVNGVIWAVQQGTSKTTVDGWKKYWNKRKSPTTVKVGEKTKVPKKFSFMG